MSYRLPHDRFYRLCSACWLTSSAILCTLLAPLHAQCVHITGYDVVYASHQLSYVNNKITHNWLCVVHNIITWPVLSYRLTHDRFCRLCSARWLTAFAILRTSFAPLHAQCAHIIGYVIKWPIATLHATYRSEVVPWGSSPTQRHQGKHRNVSAQCRQYDALRSHSHQANAQVLVVNAGILRKNQQGVTMKLVETD